MVAPDRKFFRIIDFQHGHGFIYIRLLTCAKLTRTVITAAFDRPSLFHHATVAVARADRSSGFNSLKEDRGAVAVAPTSKPTIGATAPAHRTALSVTRGSPSTSGRGEGTAMISAHGEMPRDDACNHRRCTDDRPLRTGLSVCVIPPAVRSGVVNTVFDGLAGKLTVVLAETLRAPFLIAAIQPALAG